MSCEGPLYERLWRPLLPSALNTDPPESSAALPLRCCAKRWARAERLAIRCSPAHGLARSFVDPALAFLAARGSPVRFGDRLARHPFRGRARRRARLRPAAANRLARRRLRDPQRAALGRDRISFRTLTAPDEFRGIRQRAFPHRAAAGAAGDPRRRQRRDRMAVRLSRPALRRRSATPTGCIDRPRDELGGRNLARSRRADRACPNVPPWQIVKEKRATFAATPAQNAKRPHVADALGQCRARRRLDADRPARHDRRRRRSGYKAASIVIGSGAGRAETPRHEMFRHECRPRSILRTRSRPRRWSATFRARRKPCWRASSRGRPLVLRARGRRDDPGRICAPHGISAAKSQISNSSA